MRSLTLLPAMSLGVLVLGTWGPLWAQGTHEELLEKVDDVIGRSEDQYSAYDMITEEPGKPPRAMSFEVTIKGSRFRRVEFLAPADVKGTRILVRSTSQMYIYLPAFRKVRRIASHVKEQGFMGSAYSHDEIALAVFGEIFRATGKEEHQKHWTLFLERRPDQEFLYERLEVDIRRDLLQAIEVRYLNANGQKLKTETRSEFVCGEGFCTPRKVVMTDHTRGNLKTTITLKDWQVNRGVPDSFFTVRALQRG